MRKKAGNPQWQYETCKECGKKNIPPEKDYTGKWRFPKKLICLNCLTKREEENKMLR